MTSTYTTICAHLDQKIWGCWMIVWSLIALGDISPQAAPNFSELQNLSQVDRLTDSGDDTSPSIAGDVNGTLLALWASNENLNGEIGLDKDLLLAKSVDGGATWSAPYPLDSYSYTDPEDCHSENPILFYDENQAAWIAIWRIVSGNYCYDRSDSFIRYSRSFDSGITWESSRPLFSRTNDEFFVELSFQAHMGKDGKILVIFAPNISIEALGGFPLFYTYSDDFGSTWSPISEPTGLSTDHVSSRYGPEIAEDGQGNWIIAWSDNRSPRNLHYSISRDNAATWSDPFQLPAEWTSAVGEGIGHVDIVYEQSSWLLAWNQEIDNNEQEILFTKSSDLGITWESPKQIGDVEDGVRNEITDPNITTDMFGNIHIWWEERGSFFFSHSRDVGTNWNAPKIFQPGGSFFKQVILYPVSNSKWLAITESSPPASEFYGSDADVFLWESDDSGQNWYFKSVVNINAYVDDRTDNSLSIASSNNGTTVIVWESDDSLDGRIGVDTDILYSRSIDGGKTWSEKAPLNNEFIDDGGNRTTTGRIFLIDDPDKYPQIATNGAGIWITVWEDYPHSSYYPTIRYSRSVDDGLSWSEGVNLEDELPPGGNRGGYGPRVASDGLSNWFVFWSSQSAYDGDSSLESDIIFSKSTDNGETWSAAQSVSPMSLNDTNDEWGVEIMHGGNERWYAFFNRIPYLSTSNRDSDIFVALTDNNGVSWSDPIAVTPNPDTDSFSDDSFSVTQISRDRLAIIWVSTNGLGAETKGFHKNILTSQSFDGGLTWLPPWPLQTGIVFSHELGQKTEIIYNKTGVTLAWWVLNSPPSSSATSLSPGPPNTRLFSAYSLDRGATWSDPAPFVSDHSLFVPGQERWIEAYIGPGGHVYATWSSSIDYDESYGGDFDILFSSHTPVLGDTLSLY